MSEQTVIDPESAVIGMKLGTVLVLLQVIRRSVEPPCTDYADQAMNELRDVLDILNIEID